MSKKETTIFYQQQIDICKRHFNAEQFGRLMYALFEIEEGNEPEVDDDIAIAFEFMALQKRLDREKYDKLCERNKKNGMKGGAPKGNSNASKDKNNPKQPKTTQNNPNDNDNDNDNENENDNDNDNGLIHDDDSISSFGAFGRVKLSEKEFALLKAKYRNVNRLIDKVDTWLKDAKNKVPNHYQLCIKFADNENWPKKPKEDPATDIIDIKDKLSPDEQQERMAEMTQKLGGLFTAT